MGGGNAVNDFQIAGVYHYLSNQRNFLLKLALGNAQKHCIKTINIFHHPVKAKI